MIKIENLKKKFKNQDKEITIINDVSFTVEPEKFVSIVGPSGCGKTTLLNIIGGLEKPNFGKVFVDSKEIKSPSLDIGVSFQESPLFPWKTVSKNVELALKVKITEKENLKLQIREYLKKVNLLDFANLYPKELSGGMKQKASLARVLALNSKVLLMDEPFGALDAQTRAILQEELLKIWRDFSKTVLLVTHSIDEAVFLSDKIIILSSLPAEIVEIVNVDLPRPREPELRSKKEFSELRFKIWEIIRKEILK